MKTILAAYLMLCIKVFLSSLCQHPLSTLVTGRTSIQTIWIKLQTYLSVYTADNPETRVIEQGHRGAARKEKRKQSEIGAIKTSKFINFGRSI